MNPVNIAQAELFFVSIPLASAHNCYRVLNTNITNIESSEVSPPRKFNLSDFEDIRLNCGFDIVYNSCILGNDLWIKPSDDYFHDFNSLPTKRKKEFTDFNYNELAATENNEIEIEDSTDSIKLQDEHESEKNVISITVNEVFDNSKDSTQKMRFKNLETNKNEEFISYIETSEDKEIKSSLPKNLTTTDTNIDITIENKAKIQVDNIIKSMKKIKRKLSFCKNEETIDELNEIKKNVNGFLKRLTKDQHSNDWDNDSDVFEQKSNFILEKNKGKRLTFSNRNTKRIKLYNFSKDPSNSIEDISSTDIKEKSSISNVIDDDEICNYVTVISNGL